MIYALMNATHYIRNAYSYSSGTAMTGHVRFIIIETKLGRQTIIAIK